MKSNSEAKAPMAEQPEDKKAADKGHRRKKDDGLVKDLRELYSPVLDEPVPQEFLEILRRKRPTTHQD
jgi:hypothetical protein